MSPVSQTVCRVVTAVVGPVGSEPTLTDYDAPWDCPGAVVADGVFVSDSEPVTTVADSGIDKERV